MIFIALLTESCAEDQRHRTGKEVITTDQIDNEISVVDYLTDDKYILTKFTSLWALKKKRSSLKPQEYCNYYFDLVRSKLAAYNHGHTTAKLDAQKTALQYILSSCAPNEEATQTIIEARLPVSWKSDLITKVGKLAYPENRKYLHSLVTTRPKIAPDIILLCGRKNDKGCAPYVESYIQEWGADDEQGFAHSIRNKLIELD